MKSPAFDLITIGNVCVDIYVPPYAPPPRGGITILPSLNVLPGGNGANTAITARRLGLRTALAGVLGDDIFGRYLKGFLEEEGVDTSLLELIPGEASPSTLVLNDSSGERSFVHHPGSNARFRLPPGALDASCRVFHFAAPELLPGLWPRGALEAARELKARGRRLSLDTFAVPHPADPMSVAREHSPLLALMEMVFPNESEARLITGRDALPDVTESLHSLGVRTVVVKRGEKGALLSADGFTEDVPASSVEVIDTCGAGDSFSAGFIAATLGGLDPRASTRVGCALGTLCVAYQGALTGTADTLRLEAVRRLLSTAPPI